MVEKKSRLTILVVEDNEEYGLNALSACSGHDVLYATNLEEAFPAIGRLKPDFVLSTVLFPFERGGAPVENIVPLMEIAFEANVPICFVTQADHHGTPGSNEGVILIKPLTINNLAETLEELASHGAGKATNAFASVKSTNPMFLWADAKTCEIWAKAFQLLRDACEARPRPVEFAARAVRGVPGLSVGVERGLPVLKTPRG